MRRLITKELEKWKTNGAKKPLMVIGARQTGKTYSISEFCRANYKNVYSFNLFDRSDIVALFATDINTQEKVDRLELIIGKKIDFDNSILFFDEVQESEELIASLKFFAESETNYNVICAGSLLGVKISRFQKSFPVGKVKLLYMKPMGFEEFLLAFDKVALIKEIRTCSTESKAMLKPIHDMALKLYRTYLCSGGMPEAVAQIVAVNGDVLQFDESILDDILTAYLSDMSKYIATPMEKIRIEAIYRSIPSQLGNKSLKFQYAKVNKSARARDYESALNWLLASNMVAKSDCAQTPRMPLKSYLEEGHFKLFLSDVGLLRHLLEIDSASIMLDRDFETKGLLAENYVANELILQDFSLYYWCDRNRAEVDFLIQSHEASIVPIEVKAGRNKKMSSMKVYCEKFNPQISIRLLQRNFGSSGGIKTLPLYASFCLKDIVEN